MLIRQKVVLALLDQLSRPTRSTVLVKLTFLLRQETNLRQRIAFYDFVPYHFGPFSFALYREIALLRRDGYLVKTRGVISLRDDTQVLSTKKTAELPTDIRLAVTTIAARYGAMPVEDLKQRQAEDNTSLGIFKPKRVKDIVVTPDAPDWKQSFKANLMQARIWETRGITKEPPRKIPFKFQYRFECDNTACKGHQMMIEDWELGALYWKLIDRGDSQDVAVAKVKRKFLDELCGADRDTHLFVGTVLGHGTWVVVGVWSPKLVRMPPPAATQLRLFG